MPKVLYRAREIANQYQQNILMAEFIDLKYKNEFNVSEILWHKDEQAEFIAWITANLPNTKWMECYPNYDEGWIVFPYLGHIAIIVNELDQSEAYQAIISRWENEQGEPINDRMRLYLVKHSSQ